jgi:hypothetical protein
MVSLKKSAEMKYTCWSETPLKNWNYDELVNLDFRSTKGSLIRKETGLSAKSLKIIIKEFKNKLSDDDRKEENPKIFGIVENNEKVSAILSGLATRTLLKQKGPGFFNRAKSSNPEDFCSFELVAKIDRKHFHSFYENGLIFSYDVRSLMALVKSTNESYVKKKNPSGSLTNISQITQIPKNPYTCIDIPEYTFFFVRRLIGREYLKTTGKVAKIPQKQKIVNRAFELFHFIDSFGYITDLNWFLNMDLRQLKSWYRSGHDLWNHRAQLTEQQKITISPKYIPFHLPTAFVSRINSKKSLQQIILKQIEILTMYGEDVPTRGLGCIYVLMIFTAINHEIARALPGIAQEDEGDY